METKWIFLDFDGVICNSFDECYRSSWLAWRTLPVTKPMPPEPTLDEQYYGRFLACRPYIRSGEDYVVLHDALHRGRIPRSQQEFDEELAAAGTRLPGYKKELYFVREKLLEHHRGLWLSWNPLYPGMEAALKRVASNERVFILSTKKAEFIVEILRFNGIVWPMERTLYTGSERKLAMIEVLTKKQPSLLIDDQIDHLDFDHPNCECRLALWGFIQEAWIEKASKTFSLEQALDFLAQV